MSTLTTNYDLIKPASTDFVKISDINSNMDTIDTQLKSNADGLAGKAAASHTHTKSQITDFPTIPSKLSELTNDENFKSVISTTVSIAVSAWSNNVASVTVSGVTADNIVFVAPVSTDSTNYANFLAARIYCSAQGADTLNFTCGTTPTAAISVNVIIIG